MTGTDPADTPGVRRSSRIASLPKEPAVGVQTPSTPARRTSRATSRESAEPATPSRRRGSSAQRNEGTPKRRATRETSATLDALPILMEEESETNAGVEPAISTPKKRAARTPSITLENETATPGTRRSSRVAARMSEEPEETPSAVSKQRSSKSQKSVATPDRGISNKLPVLFEEESETNDTNEVTSTPATRRSSRVAARMSEEPEVGISTPSKRRSSVSQKTGASPGRRGAKTGSKTLPLLLEEEPETTVQNEAFVSTSSNTEQSASIPVCTPDETEAIVTSPAKRRLSGSTPKATPKGTPVASDAVTASVETESVTIVPDKVDMPMTPNTPRSVTAHTPKGSEKVSTPLRKRRSSGTTPKNTPVVESIETEPEAIVSDELVNPTPLSTPRTNAEQTGDESEAMSSPKRRLSNSTPKTTPKNTSVTSNVPLASVKASPMTPNTPRSVTAHTPMEADEVSTPLRKRRSSGVTPKTTPKNTPVVESMETEPETIIPEEVVNPTPLSTPRSNADQTPKVSEDVPTSSTKRRSSGATAKTTPKNTPVTSGVPRKSVEEEPETIAPAKITEPKSLNSSPFSQKKEVCELEESDTVQSASTKRRLSFPQSALNSSSPKAVSGSVEEEQDDTTSVVPLKRSRVSKKNTARSPIVPKIITEPPRSNLRALATSDSDSMSDTDSEPVETPNVRKHKDLWNLTAKDVENLDAKLKALDDDSQDDDSDEDESEAEEVAPQKKQKRQTVVDDKFFSLDDMEKFVDQVERDGEQNVSDDEDDEDENYETDYRYADFFVENTKKSKNVGKKVRFQEEADEEEEEDDLEEMDVDAEDNEDGSMDEDMDDEDMDAPVLLGDTKENSKPLTSHEEARRKMMILIDKIQAENLNPRSWELSGEVTATDRETNSLLEKFVEADFKQKQPPINGKEKSDKIHAIVLRRYKDKLFDDVVRKYREDDTITPYRNMTVDMNERKSLMDVYEDKYKAAQNGEAEGEDVDPQIKDIQGKMSSLFEKLDAMSHFHFAPSRVREEIKIVKNMPSMRAEEVGPLAARDADETLLAPEEVSRHVKTAPKTKDERTTTDKNRERRKKKHKQHDLAKIGKMPKMGKEKQLEDQSAAAIKSNKKTKNRDFFSELQATTSREIKEKRAGIKVKKIKKKDRSDTAAKFKA